LTFFLPSDLATSFFNQSTASSAELRIIALFFGLRAKLFPKTIYLDHTGA
jgi:hypothetical protein